MPAPAVLERGRQLVLEGDTALKVPACIACHGERLTGVQPSIAGLPGQPRDYINAQFGTWRNHSAPRPRARLHGRDRQSPEPGRRRRAVSSWIAQRPLPADLTPGRRRRHCPTAAARLRQRSRLNRHEKDLADPAGRPRAVALAAWIVLAWPREQLAPSSPAAWAATPDNLARGAYLARAGDCMACHTARGGQPNTPAGARSTPRSAPSSRPTSRRTRATGIGSWSADDFWHALHNGKSRDGRLLYPAFPYHQLHQGHAGRRRCPVRFPALAAAGKTGQQPHQLRFPYNTAGRAGRLAPAVLQARRVRRKAGPVGPVEPRRLPGRGPGPLQRLPRSAQLRRRQRGQRWTAA